MKQDFITAVEAGNLPIVRIALTNELLLDPRGKSFGEMLNYAMSKLSNLYEENKVTNYDVPPHSEWNKQFLFKVKNDLDSNFSKEKLAFYQAVIEVVAKEKTEDINILEQKRIQQRTEISRKVKVSPRATTVTTGGAIITILGICAGKTLLTVLGGAVLIGGVVLLINDNRK